jgi:molybdopterin adenylyltransferase
MPAPLFGLEWPCPALVLVPLTPGSESPVIPQPVPDVDPSHALDQLVELRFVEVRAHPADAAGNVALDERHDALPFHESHVNSFRMVRALSDRHQRESDCSAMRLAILTVSTAGARGERADSSGDAIATWAREHAYEVVARELVTDDATQIAGRLLSWCDLGTVDLVLTTGGTGLSPTDVTPEATGLVIERDAPGIAEWLRMKSVNTFPRAALSRGRSGVRNRTLIVNLPGSPGGVKDSLAALDPVVEHAVAVLRGEVGDHGKG